MFKRSIALLIVFAALAGTPAVYAQKGAKPAAKPVANFGNVEGVTAKQLRDYLTFIASDELEGRDTPSRGLDIAALYLAQHLSSWGIKPAGDNGTFFQKVPLRHTKIDADKTQLRVGNQVYSYGKDFLSSTFSASVADAPMVFVGHGWMIKSKNINPYQGIDVKGKVLVIAPGVPKGVTNADLQGPDGEAYTSPGFYAQANGAKAIIAFSSFNALSNWDASRYNASDKGFVQFGKVQNAGPIPTMTVSPRVMSSILQGEKFNANNLFAKIYSGEGFESFDLKPTKKVSATLSAQTKNIYTQNVVGILEGSDPVLKNEYVAIGAHYDHDGMNPNAPGDDKIWNGADDDGSGTVAVLNIAEAFAKGAQRPKRSILFIWHAGEEKGLWGSEYFTSNPTVPITSIITQLNIDMIGRYQKPGDENHPINKELPKPGEVYTIGSHLMSTDLGELSDTVNKSFLNLVYNRKYDEPNDPNRYFYRSDHFNYARNGIPIIFYMDGTHEDYHQPSDTVDKINFEQMEKVARTIMATGWELANRPTRPKVDKPLPASVTLN